MSDNYNGYGFCLRCGALMREGTCTSCGYRDWSAGGDGRQGDGYQGRYSGQYQNPNPNGYDRPPEKKKRTRIIVVICIVIAVILAAVLVIMALNVARRFKTSALSEFYYEYEDPESGSGDDGRDYYGGSGGGSDGSYVPSEDDDYYEEITDCTRTDLEYGIVWSTTTLYPDDRTGDYITYYANYPTVSGDDDAYDSLNALIEEEVEKYKSNYTDNGCSCYVYGYVTYMAEDTLSIVLEVTLFDSEDGYTVQLSALNFNMTSFTVIEDEDMVTVDDELVLRFRAQDSTQNGGVEFVQEATDEELLELLSDPDSSVFFYTPVGLEAGINYDEGWVTVTLKDQTL